VVSKKATTHRQSCKCDEPIFGARPKRSSRGFVGLARTKIGDKKGVRGGLPSEPPPGGSPACSDFGIIARSFLRYPAAARLIDAAVHSLGKECSSCDH
jgi:hypothetical protein